MDFLPVSQDDLRAHNIQQLDFVFVSGDAYVDHPSFAAALLGRWLEKHGYTVGIIPQPDFKNVEAFRVLGKPRLAFLVSAGAMDSMVSNYTANNKPRSEDAYAHGGVAGHRPDRALITYVAKCREAYKGVPVLIGGIEASLRRTTHYDYWSNKVRKSILLDSKADLLMYGMGEKENEGVKLNPVEIAKRIAQIEKDTPILQGRKIIGIADPSIFDESRGQSVAQMMEQSPHFIYFCPADNTRIAGKMQIHRRLQWKQNGKPGLYFFSNCTHMIRTLPTLCYSKQNVEDVDTTGEDHLYDVLRYALMARPYAMPEVSKPKHYILDPLNDSVESLWI